MFRKHSGVKVVAVLALLAVLSICLTVGVNAQPAGERAAAQRFQNGQEITIEGRVIDLHCAMTGQYASADHAKCTADCLRAGVPAALETEDGVFVLGHGTTGPAKMTMPLAFQEVEVTGKVYQKGGVNYLDIATIEALED